MHFAGGYICKKFRTALYPNTIGYNLGYCWPSLPNNTCPTGWTQYNPGSGNFCYFPITGVYAGSDEIYRQCHQMGADQTYIENGAEVTYLKGVGILSLAFNNQVNAHRFRYGPYGLPNNLTTSFTWSTGINVYNNYGLEWLNPPEPNDDCTAESCLQFLTNLKMNDITCFVMSVLLVT